MTTGGKSGFTFVELAIVMTLFAIVAGVIATTGQSVGRAFRTGTSIAEVESTAHRALIKIGERLLISNRTSVNPRPAPPFSSDWIEFQANEGFDGDDIVWGNAERIRREDSPTDPTDGTDNDGDGLVDESDVVWIQNFNLANERRVVLCRNVRSFLEGETPDGLDQNENDLRDERGFCVSHTGNRVTIRLTIEGMTAEGIRVARTVERTVALRVGGA